MTNWQVRQSILKASGWSTINIDIAWFDLLSIVYKAQESERESGDLKMLSKICLHLRQCLAVVAWDYGEIFAWHYQNCARSNMCKHSDCFILQVQGTISYHTSGFLWLLEKLSLVRVFPLAELTYVLKRCPCIIAVKKHSETDHEGYDREEWHLSRIKRLLDGCVAEKAIVLNEFCTISASWSTFLRVSFISWPNPWWMIRDLCRGVLTAYGNHV
jgi:hypothetical protein